MKIQSTYLQLMLYLTLLEKQEGFLWSHFIWMII